MRRCSFSGMCEGRSLQFVIDYKMKTEAAHWFADEVIAMSARTERTGKDDAMKTDAGTMLFRPHPRSLSKGEGGQEFVI